MFSGFSAKSTVCCAFCMLSHPGWQFLKSQKVESVHWDAAFLIQVMSGDWKSHLDEWRNICPAGNTAPGWTVSFLGYCTVTHSNKITRKLLAGPHYHILHLYVAAKIVQQENWSYIPSDLMEKSAFAPFHRWRQSCGLRQRLISHCQSQEEDQLLQRTRGAAARHLRDWPIPWNHHQREPVPDHRPARVPHPGKYLLMEQERYKDEINTVCKFRLG